MLFTTLFRFFSRFRMTWIYVFILSVVFISGCSSQNQDSLVIAEQYGLAYAPLQIMQKKGFLEEAFDSDVKVEWVKLGNTTAIREAMLAEGLDIGFMGIPPFLIGVDQGMEWKIMNGLSESPLGLVTNEADITSLKDLIDAGKIALPQPGSIQHILLSMTAKKILGQSDIFDQQLISMNHPDGYQALCVDDHVVAHYTAPPYLFYALEDDNNHLLTTGIEGVGDRFTFIVGVCQPSFYQNTVQYNAFQEALERSIKFIYEYPEETLDILSEAYVLDREVLRGYLYHEQMLYSTEVRGLDTFIQFMYEQSYLKMQWEADEMLWKSAN